MSFKLLKGLLTLFYPLEPFWTLKFFGKRKAYVCGFRIKQFKAATILVQLSTFFGFCNDFMSKRT